MRIELIDQQCAPVLACKAYPARELLARDMFPGRVVGVREKQRRKTATLDFALQIGRREGITSLGLEQYRNRCERLENIEEFLVGRVIREKVSKVDTAQACRGPRERGTPAARHTDVLCRVLRGETAPIAPVVVSRNALPQLPDSGHGRIFLIIESDLDTRAPRRRAGKGPGLRLPLAEVAPVEGLWAESKLRRFRRHVNDAGSGNFAE